jgi:hypothetical protein
MGNTGSSSSQQGAARIAADNIAISGRRRVIRFTPGNLFAPERMSHLRHHQTTSARDFESLDIKIPKTRTLSDPHQIMLTYSSENSKTDIDLFLNAKSGVAYSTKLVLFGKAHESTTIRVKGKVYLLEAVHEIELIGTPFITKEEREAEARDFEFFSDPKIITTHFISLHRNGTEPLRIASYKPNSFTGQVKLVAYEAQE